MVLVHQITLQHLVPQALNPSHSKWCWCTKSPCNNLFHGHYIHHTRNGAGAPNHPAAPCSMGIKSITLEMVLVHQITLQHLVPRALNPSHSKWCRFTKSPCSTLFRGH